MEIRKLEIVRRQQDQVIIGTGAFAVEVSARTNKDGTCTIIIYAPDRVAVHRREVVEQLVEQGQMTVPGLWREREERILEEQALVAWEDEMRERHGQFPLGC